MSNQPLFKRFLTNIGSTQVCTEVVDASYSFKAPLIMALITFSKLLKL